MSTSTINNNLRKTEILNVAVSTDTILYTPFLLAYHGGDFENTPFCKLSVNIIGTEDLRFEQKEKLKGDGFATFCLLFGLADAAICDPSYLVYLSDGSAVNIQNEFENFEKLLTVHTKDKLNKKFSEILKLERNKLSIANIDKFNQLFINKKVIGGLISKMAFSVAASPDLYTTINLSAYKEEQEKFGFEHKKNSTKKSFISKEISDAKGKFIFYKMPSTGYCIGRIHAEKYGKIAENSLMDDFGCELKLLRNLSNKKSLSITCDFVSLDYLLNKDKDDDLSRNTQITQIQDLALDKQNYLFTGILGNTEIRHEEKLKAFLYGIDKNLYAISKFLNDDDTTGLTKYFKNKFQYSENKQLELLNLLVADEECRKTIDELINNKDKPKFTFDTIIRYYVDRLYAWNTCGGLYYDSTYKMEKIENIEKLKLEDDLKNIVIFRYDAIDKDHSTIDERIKKVIHSDLLNSWRITEKRFCYYENSINSLGLVEKRNDFIILLSTPIILLSKKKALKLQRKLWLYISKPTYLYTVGSVFLIFEILSSIFHITNHHLSFMTIVEWFSNNQSSTFYSFILCFAFLLDIVIFIYISITLISLIYLTRELIKLKENDIYVYRNE